MARRGLPPHQAHHLRRRPRTPQLCQADLPQHPHPIITPCFQMLFPTKISLSYLLLKLCTTPLLLNNQNDSPLKVVKLVNIISHPVTLKMQSNIQNGVFQTIVLCSIAEIVKAMP